MSCDNTLRLSLRHPNGWGWKLTTSASSPHISVPTVQLVDHNGHLLALLPSPLKNSASTGSIPRKRRKKRPKSVRFCMDIQYDKGEHTIFFLHF